MKLTTFPIRPRTVLPIAGLIAALSAVVALAFSGGQAAQGHIHAAKHGTQSAKQLAFHDGMRMLWEDHIVWTRMAIVSFAAGSPDFDVTAARLLANQEDIGNAIKPYYGRRAGEALEALLKEHITGAVELLKAAKSGDQAKLAQARDAWYRNGNEIAAFLNKANPKHWKLGKLRAMMRGHLDQTLDEATARLKGDFAADILAYDAIHHHIITMADTLSEGIVKQFPHRFR